MKKIIGLLVASAFITACDDGDMVFENLNFDGVQIQKCTDNELYFKINNNELLLVDFTRPISATQSGSWLDSEVELDRRTSPDRKSTRLNSSHVRISYAVFCLKKKK